MNSLEELLTGLGTHSKIIFIEKGLSSSINNLIQFSQLKTTTNITNVFWFNNTITNIPSDILINNHITFLIKSNLSNIDTLKERVQEILQISKQFKLSKDLINIDLLLTDDYFETFKYKLNLAGLIGDLNSIKSWKLFIANDDILNLNLNEFNSLYLFKTSNLSFKLASVLNNYLIENPDLKITHILSKGLNSSKFVNIFKYLQNNNVNLNNDLLNSKKELKISKGLYGSKSNNSGKQCDLIVFERNLDFLSCFLNQLSFIGLIDDVYNIDLNSIKLDSNDIIFLNSNDEMFNKVKFKNFGYSCDYLNLKAVELKNEFNEFNNLNKSNTNEVSKFVTNLSNLESIKTSISNLTKVSEEILIKLNANGENSNFNKLLEFQQDILLQNQSYSNIFKKILEFIYNKTFSINDILRLIIITSIVFNGLKEKDFNQLTQELVEFHGVKYLLLLQNFIKIGIISIRGDLSIIKNFNHLNLKFDLIPDSIDEELDIDDEFQSSIPNFAYRGYVPLMTRILQHSIRPNKRSTWKNLELNSLILGKTIDEELLPSHSLTNNYSETYLNNDTLGGNLQNDSTVFIVMIGGLTYSELATIKFVEAEFKKKYNINKKFIIITDNFINANSIIDSCLS